MFLNVLTQVIILLILILVGAVLAKGKILTSDGVKHDRYGADDSYSLCDN